MKILALALALAFGSSLPTEKGLKIGDKAPLTDRSMKDVNGKNFTLTQQMSANGLLVIFSCNTCPFVIATQERYIHIAKVAKANKIGLIVVNSNEAQRGDVDSFDEMKRYAQEQAYDFPYVVDEKHVLADAFGATKTPDIFLFDKDFILKYKGAIDDSHRNPENVRNRFLENAIKALVQGEKIDPAITPAVGCTIKRVG
jgi:peroxiredoxin